MSTQARAWLDRGSFYTWSPSMFEGSREVEIFHIEAGAGDAPLVVLVHGFPTSSIDWWDIFDALAERYRISALDFPGYGFSDKPQEWPYSLQLDAELLLHHVVEVLGADTCRVVAHDRGDSVTLLAHHLLLSDGEAAGVSIDHLVLSNGNIFLPLANLTEFQKRLFDPSSAPEVLELVTPELLAQGMASATFTPPRSSDDATVTALASTFAYHEGTAVLHQTIQYLRERAENEVSWLQSLAASTVPSTMIWGICDTVSPLRVAMHVWEHYLRHKSGRNEFWVVPGADHYLQNDRPEAFVEAVTQSIERPGAGTPGPTTPSAVAPILVDRSSPSLPAAIEVFRF